MTKIEALEKTIYNLENGVYEYSWTDIDRCNCGVVARTLLVNKTARQAGFNIGITGCGFSGCYKNTVKRCASTGTPMPEVFAVLKETGFTFDELKNLELLSDVAINKRAGLTGRSVKFDDKGNLIKYLRAWVEILKEQTPVQEKEQKPERIKTVYVYVSVPETIKEQSLQLIQN